MGQKTDPLYGNRRNLIMLFGHDHADAIYDPAPAIAQAASRRPIPRGISVTEQTKTQWLAQVEAVAKLRDKGAFAELFRHFAPRVKGFLMKSGMAEGLAEDCMQDVMATLWHKAHLYDPSRASVATWIFTITRNRRIDLLRKAARPEPEDLPWGPEAEPDQADVMAFQQEASQLAEAIAALPDKQRTLIQQAYFGDLSHSEIAAETGLPLGTIKSRIRLALDRLRHAMNAQTSNRTTDT